MADRKPKQCGRCYCRPEKRQQSKKQRTNPNYCPECGLKYRSIKHRDGAQHKKIVAHIAKETRLNAGKTTTSIYKQT